MKRSTIPTLIGVLILIIGLAAGIFLVQSRNIFRLGASAENTPKDVRTSNFSDTSFTVSWTTDKETSGFVLWGEKEDLLSKVENDEVTPNGLTHSVTIRNLKAETNYFFKINSGGTEFDNNGVVWKVITGPSLTPPIQTIIISGSVLTQTGAPSANSLVYVSVGGSLLSSLTSQSGTWVVPLSSARTQDLQNFLTINESTTLLEISVQAGGDQVATAQIYPQSAKPAPAIILGQTHDFKSLPPSPEGEIPKASIGLPTEATPSSGFTIPEETATPSASTVTLTSVKEGEVVTSTNPEFFGEGPKGTTIIITVESEPQTAQVSVSSSGDWKWSPPAGLSPGSHTITISWRDAAGILRTLTRTFIVQASEGPAFESTPSATPTSTPASTPKATATPTPTSSATPIATISATPTTSAAPQPISGSLTPTIALFIMGVGVILSGFYVWKVAEEK
jgi:hypothetical protein